jgi:hypothetical protein
MTVLDSHQARQALVQYTGKKVLARSDGMRVNEMFIILALLVMPIWQTFCVVAAASDVKQPDIRIPPEASVELEPVSALSILPNTPNNDSKSLVQILELNLARAEFDDETFAGNINLWGFTLALGLDSRYEIGYSYLTNTHLYGDWEPSLDEGPELASYEDFDISSKLIYLRRNWLIEDRLGPGWLFESRDRDPFDRGMLFRLRRTDQGIGRGNNLRQPAVGFRLGCRHSMANRPIWGLDVEVCRSIPW